MRMSYEELKDIELIKCIEEAYISMKRGKCHAKEEKAKERAKRRQKRKKRGEKDYESASDDLEATSEQEEEYFMSRRKLVQERIQARERAKANKKQLRLAKAVGEDVIVSDSNSEEEYEKCDHEYTMRTKGHNTCLSCGLEEKYLTKVSEEGYESRMYLRDTGPDHIVEIRREMREIMSLYTNGTHYYQEEIFDHQTTDIYDEFFDWSEELCQIYNEYKLPVGHRLKKVKRGSPIHCRTKSLCATVLWEKMKSEFPDETLTDFAKKVGVTKPTINNTRKKMRQIDLN